MTVLPFRSVLDFTAESCINGKSLYMHTADFENIHTRFSTYLRLSSYINISKNQQLKFLCCEYNKISSLNTSHNVKLTELFCDDNQIINLDLRNNVALKYSHCNRNQLTSLDVNNNSALQELECQENNLSSLDLRNNHELGNQMYSLLNLLKEK